MSYTGYSLEGKRIAITGSTGDLAEQLCPKLLSDGAELVLLNRSLEKTTIQRHHFKVSHPEGNVEFLETDLTNPVSLEKTIQALTEHPVDILFLAAGVYQTERNRTAFGYDCIFTANFLAHYILVKKLLPVLRSRHAKVIAVGSIAYRYSETDPQDPDFTNREGCAIPYGNSKRYLMAALSELLEDEPDIEFVLTHPGVAFTRMSAHYPAEVYRVLKHPLQKILAKPEDAVESLYAAFVKPVPKGFWVGPELFDTWGKPTVKPVTGISKAEREQIFQTAEKLFCEYEKNWE